jgi:ketosteroid isomerase-like protein
MVGTVEEHRKLAQALVDRWTIEKGGDIDPYFELYHDDATFTTMAQPVQFPYIAGTLTKSQFREWVWKETRVTSTKLNLEGVIVEGDRMSVEVSSDMNVGGNSYKNCYHWAFEIRDGKIAAARYYLDTLFAINAIKWIDAEEKKKVAK